jgi:hypothetical protein
MIANMLGVETLPIKPGSVGKAVCVMTLKYLMKKEMKCKQINKDMWW